MIGYWLVVAMVVCALLAVVLATTLAATKHAEPARQRSAAPRPIWAALGASDATGEGATDPSRDNWVAQLAAALPTGSADVHNLGMGGALLADVRRDQLPRTIALRPAVVTCWLVVNDLTAGLPLDSYERELTALLAELSQTNARVIVGNLPDLWLLPILAGNAEATAQVRQTVELWNAAIARIAATAGAVLVDLSDGPIAPEDLSADGFHPSSAGHARLAARFQPAVEAAIAEARSPAPQATSP